MKSICFLHQNVNLVLLCYKYPNLKEMVSFFLSSAFKITAQQWSVTAILRDKNQCQWSFWPVILSMLYINDFCYILYSKFHVKLLIHFFLFIAQFHTAVLVFHDKKTKIIVFKWQAKLCKKSYFTFWLKTVLPSSNIKIFS